MKTLNLLAIDLGASNGRGILGQFDGERVRLQELHRFENEYIPLHGTVYWDILRLFENAKAALRAAGKAGITLDAFGIDTWGVDYGLLDAGGGSKRQAAGQCDRLPQYDGCGYGTDVAAGEPPHPV